MPQPAAHVLLISNVVPDANRRDRCDRRALIELREAGSAAEFEHHEDPPRTGVDHALAGIFTEERGRTLRCGRPPRPDMLATDDVGDWALQDAGPNIEGPQHVAILRIDRLQLAVLASRRRPDRRRVVNAPLRNGRSS